LAAVDRWQLIFGLHSGAIHQQTITNDSHSEYPPAEGFKLSVFNVNRISISKPNHAHSGVPLEIHVRPVYPTKKDLTLYSSSIVELAKQPEFGGVDAALTSGVARVLGTGEKMIAEFACCVVTRIKP